MNRWTGLLLALLMMIATSCAPLEPEQEPLSSATFERALTLLRMQARSADPIVRANCIEALQVSRDPRALEVIEQGLHDKEWVVRFAAAMAAGHRKAASMRPVLNTLVTTDPDLSVRAGCIYALKQLGDERHMSGLAVALQSRDPSTRANAALVLGMLKDPSAIPLLQMYRDDSDIRVKFELTAALARLGDEPSQQVIAGWAVNRYAEDQWSAMVVCADLPPEVALSPLLLGLEDVPSQLPESAAGSAPDRATITFLTTCRRLIAARSLAKQRNGAGSTVALENCTNSVPQLRALAVLALGELLTSRQAPALEPMLDDPEEAVRRAAAAAIINIYARVIPPQ